MTCLNHQVPTKNTCFAHSLSQNGTGFTDLARKLDRLILSRLTEAWQLRQSWRNSPKDSKGAQTSNPRHEGRHMREESLRQS